MEEGRRGGVEGEGDGRRGFVAVGVGGEVGEPVDGALGRVRPGRVGEDAGRRDGQLAEPPLQAEAPVGVGGVVDHGPFSVSDAADPAKAVGPEAVGRSVGHQIAGLRGSGCDGRGIVAEPDALVVADLQHQVGLCGVPVPVGEGHVEGDDIAVPLL
ncbi:hypothetical protein [Phenylobacterium sp. J367]|uniref:hypothetical protein n=1 Tax=Phenylobacterium sp. J367 TaxID=2898435 RepID=UPI002151257E|nr:hypothetical protein [Phenylobacterium sp. J367]MCR5878389.1 hypothetical protein [Phenylobacterium sp. J367]